MMFITMIFGGFLFATVCSAEKPRIATLEVKPNFDQGLTHKDFRVQFAGVPETSNQVKIKIFKQGDSDLNPFHSFTVQDAKMPKAYYFGLQGADAGKYEVQVCDGSDCSDRNPSLTNILSEGEKGKVTCVKGSYDSNKKWSDATTEPAEFSLDVIKAGDWLKQSDISLIETPLTNPVTGETYKTEWSRNNINSNPSYESKRLYAAVFYNVTHYRELFLKKGTIGGSDDNRAVYTHDFCKRKYLLSSHIHLVETESREVKYRFKKTLYLSSQGKKYFIYDNNGEKGHKVPIEMTFENEEIAPATYDVWVSFCATEKDKVESTVCSDPVINDEKLTVRSGHE